MIPDKSQLTQYAADNQFNRDAYEKMCRLSEILSVFASDDFLATHLALKGGTAINMAFLSVPRLSVDIDLDLAINVPRSEMLQVKQKLAQIIIGYMEHMGYLLDKAHEKDTHALHSMVFNYTNLGGNRDRLKVEVNFMLREHILEPKRCAIHCLQGFTPSKPLCVNPIEIYAAKIVALTSRAAARDLYDVYNMIQQQLFDTAQIQMLKKCAIIYAVMNSGANEPFQGFDISHMMSKITMLEAKKSLFPMIHKTSGRGKFDLDNVKTMVAEFIRSSLSLSQNEQTFLKAFYSGELKLGLLFDSKEIIQRLQTHPMLLRKLEQIEQAHGDPSMPLKTKQHTISRAKRAEINTRAQRAGHTDKAQQRGAQTHSHDDELS